MSRQASLHAGRSGPVQRFSLARVPNDAVNTLLARTLRPTTLPAQRDQILGDATRCFQFVMTWDGSIGIFTRPEVDLSETAAADPLVFGSFSDTIGHSVPVSVRYSDFTGYVTTLVRSADAATFGLAIHPSGPDTLDGPPAAAGDDPIDGTLARLQFGAAPEAGDRPVIAALPCFLPLGPGQSFPDCPLPFTANTSFRDTFPLLEVYRNGMSYLTRMNTGCSVTLGGPLFHMPDGHGIPLPLGADDPFASFRILPRLPVAPLLLSPVGPSYARVVANVTELSETVWVDLGGAMPVPPPGRWRWYFRRTNQGHCRALGSFPKFRADSQRP